MRLTFYNACGIILFLPKTGMNLGPGQGQKRSLGFQPKNPEGGQQWLSFRT